MQLDVEGKLQLVVSVSQNVLIPDAGTLVKVRLAGWLNSFSN